MTTRIFSSGIRRREDPRLITGRANYTGDIDLPGTVHAAFLRSPHAHARLASIDTSRADFRKTLANDRNAKLLDVLTREQKKAFEKMKGAKFELRRRLQPRAVR